MGFSQYNGASKPKPTGMHENEISQLNLDGINIFDFT